MPDTPLDFDAVRRRCQALTNDIRLRTVFNLELSDRPDGLPDDGDIEQLLFLESALAKVVEILDHTEDAHQDNRDWEQYVLDRLQSGDAGHGRRTTPAALPRLIPAIVVTLGLAVIAATLYGTTSTPPAPAPDHVTCPVSGTRLVRVPAGSITLGTSAEDIEHVLASDTFGRTATRRIRSEQHQGSHDVDALYVAATEVTVRQFRQFVVDTGHIPRSELMRGQGHDGEGWTRSHDFHWDHLGQVEHDDRMPVVNVTFRDAIAYCEWLSSKTGYTYRLPTEPEWTHAARAGSRTYWHCGDDVADTLDHGWTAATAGHKPHPVAQLAPNAWGLHDTLGNAWEWCDSHFDASRPYRLAKGGSWRATPWLARPAARIGVRDTFISAALGFRVVREIRPR